MMTVSNDLLALAKSAMTEKLLDSRWYTSAPESARKKMPVIKVLGIEQRKVSLSIGVLPAGSYDMPFLIGEVTVGDITAKLAMRVDFGAGLPGLVVEEL